MKILAILQARMTSSRLPGKILKSILGKPMIYREIERIRRSRKIDALVLATSNESSDDVVETLCKEENLTVFRGDRDDVLDRFYQAATSHRGDVIVRLTGDCPLIDPQIIDHVISTYLNGAYDYVSNTLQPTYPDGLDVEVFSLSCLETAWKEAKRGFHREHVTQFIVSQPGRFKMTNVTNPTDLSALRWTVDEPADFDVVTEIYGKLFPIKPAFTMNDVLSLLEASPYLKTKNACFERNEGLKKSIREDNAANVQKI